MACYATPPGGDGKHFPQGATTPWLAKVPLPEETILMGEISMFISPAGLYMPPTAAWVVGLKNTPPFACAYPDQKTLDQWWVNAAFRHQGGMNIIFYDGHTKWTHEDTLLSKPETFVTTGAAGG